MERFLRLLMCLAAGFALGSCASPPPPDSATPGPMARQIVAERLSAVVVTARKDISGWAGDQFSRGAAPGDADGGSAAPISPDGYLLTADHVLARMNGRNVFVIYGRGGRLITKPARVVWRDAASDLALLHIPLQTPYFYRWTPPGRWFPAGSEVIHGGIATGFKSPPGRMVSSLAPERTFTGARKFRIDIPLQPGDSGGPVVDAVGGLVGINSAVEFLVPMETAFFVDSEGNRPSVRQMEVIMARDRARNR